MNRTAVLGELKLAEPFGYDKLLESSLESAFSAGGFAGALAEARNADEFGLLPAATAILYHDLRQTPHAERTPTDSPSASVMAEYIRGFRGGEEERPSITALIVAADLLGGRPRDRPVVARYAAQVAMRMVPKEVIFPPGTQGRHELLMAVRPIIKRRYGLELTQPKVAETLMWGEIIYRIGKELPDGSPLLMAAAARSFEDAYELNGAHAGACPLSLKVLYSDLQGVRRRFDVAKWELGRKKTDAYRAGLQGIAGEAQRQIAEIIREYPSLVERPDQGMDSKEWQREWRELGLSAKYNTAVLEPLDVLTRRAQFGGAKDFEEFINAVVALYERATHEDLQPGSEFMRIWRQAIPTLLRSLSGRSEEIQMGHVSPAEALFIESFEPPSRDGRAQIDVLRQALTEAAYTHYDMPLQVEGIGMVNGKEGTVKSYHPDLHSEEIRRTIRAGYVHHLQGISWGVYQLNPEQQRLRGALEIRRYQRLVNVASGARQRALPFVIPELSGRRSRY